jgi:hypothetical protein
MIAISPESNGKILIISATGKLTDKDYKEVLIPRLEKIIQEHGKARLLLDMGDKFHGWEAAAAWDDARFGLAHMDDFEKMGVIGGPKWVEWCLKIGAVVINGEIKNFPADKRDQAMSWIKS